MTTPLQDGDPARIGDFTLHRRLAVGGMGVVYLGRSPGGRVVAVKTVRPDLASDPEFRRRFTTEVRTARKVGGFYGAEIAAADTEGDPPWLATTYLPGPTLHQAVAGSGPLPAASAAVLGAGLAEALKAVHARDVIHRDIKPGNIILGEDGPRLIDFGIARALDATSYTRTGTVMGTAAFMPPEQILGDAVGPPGDVFSLGCVLVFASTGRGPFGDGPAHAMTYRIVHGEPDLSGVPDGFAPTVERCLAKEAADRPTPDEVLGAFRALADAGDVPGAGGAWPPESVTEVITLHKTLLMTLVDSEPQEPDRKKEGSAARSGTRAKEKPGGSKGAEEQRKGTKQGKGEGSKQGKKGGGSRPEAEGHDTRRETHYKAMADAFHGRVDDLGREGEKVGWDATAERFRGRDHHSFSYVLPPGGTKNAGSVWGDGIYSDDSSVGLAAVHAGLITLQSGGRVTFTVRPGRESYRASTRNGITSRTWDEWSGSFEFVRGPGDSWKPPKGAERWGTSSNAVSAGKRDPKPAAPKKQPEKPPEPQEDGGNGWWWALGCAVVFLLLYANHFGFAAWVGQAVNDGVSDIEAGDCLAVYEEAESSVYTEVFCLAANSRYEVLAVRPGEELYEADATSASGLRSRCEDVSESDQIVVLGGNALCLEDVG
ncbi:LCCL domain-containing protein [Nocardiopsis sp. NPDC057823]|uniref:protein kinase domain-containing protein n=1 Tax=Nocardiopsis sp. NPDC057823 TaxID=3346256 RepID=UPI00367006FD